MEPKYFQVSGELKKEKNLESMYYFKRLNLEFSKVDELEFVA